MNDSQKQWLDHLVRRGGHVDAATVVDLIKQLEAKYRAEMDAIIRDAQEDQQAVIDQAAKVREPFVALAWALVDYGDQWPVSSSHPLAAMINSARQLVGREADAVQGEDDACDCGKIEHGRHHMLCPALKRKGGA